MVMGWNGRGAGGAWAAGATPRYGGPTRPAAFSGGIKKFQFWDNPSESVLSLLDNFDEVFSYGTQKYRIFI